MAGYVRQSVATIIAGADINAAPLNAEFNQLAAAFHQTTGHTHAGTSGDGPKIPLATSVDGILTPTNGGVGAALTTTVDNTIPRFNGTGGILQTSTAVIEDSGNLTITSTDAGSTTGPLISVYRDSASPAALDFIGQYQFDGEDSAGNKQTYAAIVTQILDPTSTTEDGELRIYTATAGAVSQVAAFNGTGLTITGTGVFSGNVTANGNRVPEIYSGTTDDATNYTIGSMIMIESSSDLDINSSVTNVRALDEGNNGSYVIFATGVPGSGTWGSVTLDGTWRVRGRAAGTQFSYSYLSQRIS